MGKKMVDTHKGELIDLAEPLGIVEPHQQSGDKPRSLSDGDGEISFKVTPACFRAPETTGDRAFRCSLAASSGTTPPWTACLAICEATSLESTLNPSSTTDAAVSSQLLSIPRIRLISTQRAPAKDLTPSPVPVNQ